jgi:leucyl-tRNA synthetase
MVNWCPALGTVLANDEVIDGLSERGGHPVEQKRMRQWSLRVSAYAQRLLDGLDTIEWTESLKETQRNWIGRSEGAEIHLPLAPSKGGGKSTEKPHYHTTGKLDWDTNIDNAREHRKNPTQAESLLWEMLRAKKTGFRFRRQHLIDKFIVDFVCLENKLIIEVDGGYHGTTEQQRSDAERENILKTHGFQILRFTNEEVLGNIDAVIQTISKALIPSFPPSFGGGRGEVVVFTTRPDTIYGVTFMVLAPESEYVAELTTDAQSVEVQAYLEQTRRRTERERIADRRVTGVFTGSYAINPFTGEEIPIWISDYVLAGYGTGAIMAVPAHDSRDYAFAKHFGLPIVPLIEGCDVSEESFDAKEGIMVNSGILNGLTVPEAIRRAKEVICEDEIGRVKVNYRLRDAIFSRQRYWGEPFPIYYKDGMPYTVDEADLPIELPEVDKFLPTETGEPPLGRAKEWTYKGYPLELCTMPGFAGSSAYYMRYEDPRNASALVSPEAGGYWRNVDLYIGGTEHATGHLIYSRFWNKFLYDLGIVQDEEPFRKLINQGMIQGRSNFVYRIRESNTFVSCRLKDRYDTTELHVDVNIVHNDVLDTEAFKAWRPEFASAEFILEDGKYICGWAIEKMSKSMYNVVNPDRIVEQYGADTLRMYEMFLGPLEQSKPWDTAGIEGVHRFLRKVWNLFHLPPSPSKGGGDCLKTLHKTIKKVTADIENFSFNTAVSAFMICVNELLDQKCTDREILEPYLILLAPFAPHIAEELWQALGHGESITGARYPAANEQYLVENSFTYPVSFNGKTRFTIELPADMDAKTIEATVLATEGALKWTEGKTPRKVIVVPKKIINVVV